MVFERVCSTSFPRLVSGLEICSPSARAWPGNAPDVVERPVDRLKLCQGKLDRWEIDGRSVDRGQIERWQVDGRSPNDRKLDCCQVDWRHIDGGQVDGWHIDSPSAISDGSISGTSIAGTSRGGSPATGSSIDGRSSGGRSGGGRSGGGSCPGDEPGPELPPADGSPGPPGPGGPLTPVGPVGAPGDGSAGGPFEGALAAGGAPVAGPPAPAACPAASGGADDDPYSGVLPGASLGSTPADTLPSRSGTVLVRLSSVVGAAWATAAGSDPSIAAAGADGIVAGAGGVRWPMLEVLRADARIPRAPDVRVTYPGPCSPAGRRRPVPTSTSAPRSADVTGSRRSGREPARRPLPGRPACRALVRRPGRARRLSRRAARRPPRAGSRSPVVGSARRPCRSDR